MLTFGTIKKNLVTIRDELSQLSVNPTIIAVTKGQKHEVISLLLQLGLNNFGENYSKQLKERGGNNAVSHAVWHYLGQLQSNKIKQIVAHCDTIQSIDSDKYLSLINKNASVSSKTMQLCIQVKFSPNPNRGGILVNKNRIIDLAICINQYSNLKFLGLMTILETGLSCLEQEKRFASMHRIFSDIKNSSMLSMGMSSDYQLAVKHGATHIRIGAKLLGSK